MMLVKHAASAGGGILEHFEESCHPVFRAEKDSGNRHLL
jgi:hypothetical protein